MSHLFNPHYTEAKLSRELYETSRQAAHTRKSRLGRIGTFGGYGRYAVGLLNFASIHGFSTTSTVLHTKETDVALPHLARKDEGKHSVRLHLQLDSEDERILNHFAEQASISRAERVRRSLRFANFVVEHTIFDPREQFMPLQFLHRGELVEYPVFGHHVYLSTVLREEDKQ